MTNLNAGNPNVVRRAPRRSQPTRGPSTELKLGNLRVGQKLGLIAVVFLVPVLVLLFLLIREQQVRIDFATKEKVGVEYLRPMANVNREVQAYFLASVSQAEGAESQAAKDAAGRVDAALRTLQAVSEQNPRVAVQAEIDRMIAGWQSIRVVAPNLSRDNLMATYVSSYSDFKSQYFQPLIVAVGNKSNLILDPDLESYYTMDLAVLQLPELYAQVTGLRLTSEPLVSATALTEQQRVLLISDLAEVLNTVELVARSSQYAVDSNANLQETIGAVTAEVQAAVTAYAAALELLTTGTLSATEVQQLRVLASTAEASVANLMTVSHDTLDTLLDRRIGGFERDRIVSLVSVAAVLIIAALLLVVVAGTITRPLSQLAEASTELGKGNLNVFVKVDGTDEIGTVGKTFNDAIARLREIDQRNALDREHAEMLQQNIGAFLDVTMDIAEGDFTKRGRVTEDVLGNVVDSINVMVDELSAVLGSVQTAASSVQTGADRMLGTTDSIVEGAEFTAAAAQRVSTEVTGVTESIRRMAQSAQASAQTAEQALSASEQGQDAVERTLAGMQNIRREVQGISKRIKALGDRSLEIQEIVDTISRLSSQTNLLALNAAIEAAGAGEAGSRFAIVADEVRKLAESSAQSTARIATLIKNVQSEIGEVVASVEDGTREVESGYRVAGTAGERLQEIAQLARQSAELARTISEATSAQVQSVEQVSEAVGSIASIAGDTREQVQAGREAAEQLRVLSDQLTEQLTRFRLEA